MLLQVYSTNLAQVVDIVVSHQGIDIKTQLIGQLMSALVLPAPEHYRPLLRRLAALSTSLGPSLSCLLTTVAHSFSERRVPGLTEGMHAHSRTRIALTCSFVQLCQALHQDARDLPMNCRLAMTALYVHSVMTDMQCVPNRGLHASYMQCTPNGRDCVLHCAGNGSAEVAYRAQQLLEHSLLSELRAIVARALSGLDMFAGGQLSELDLLGSDFLETTSSEQASCALPFLRKEYRAAPQPGFRHT